MKKQFECCGNWDEHGVCKCNIMEDKGLRFNKGKLRYDLINPIAEEGLVRVITKGAEKYAERNWEKGMKWTTVLASMKRHIAAFEKGEDFDPETGELHINHIQCNAHFLSAYYKIYPQGDDRQHSYLNKVRIAIDIDEVICNWIGSWCNNVPECWYFDRDLLNKFEQMREEGRLDEFYSNLDPLISPAEMPFEPYCYITSRPVDSQVTERWLSKHGFPERPVFTLAPGETKVEVALREKIDIFVDDAFHNFQDLNKAGVCCFLYDAPHNRRYDVGFKRIKSLKEIM